MRCEGKIVLVTGAQRGIGRAVALHFAQEGADVALNFLDDQPAAESGAAQIAALGRRCCVIQGDISKAAEVRRLVATAEHDLGPIDVLVNNAGIFPVMAPSRSRYPRRRTQSNNAATPSEDERPYDRLQSSTARARAGHVHQGTVSPLPFDHQSRGPSLWLLSRMF